MILYNVINEYMLPLVPSELKIYFSFYTPYSINLNIGGQEILVLLNIPRSS